MITEHDVTAKWRRLFSKGKVTPKTFRDARQLLEHLRPESPLRSRLTVELEEIRSLRRRSKKAK